MADIPQRRPVVMVTGASAGVGRSVVRRLAQGHQARLGLLARGAERLEATRREVEQLGGEALVIPADVANADAVERAAATLEDHFGPIDLWINNAMASMMAPFKQMTLEEFRRITEVTYLGYVHGTHSALKRMLARDHGVIVQVGSALSYRSIPLQSAYCGAKHAIVGFTEALRTELIHDNSAVQLRMVHLPAVNTPQFDWIRNRMGGKSKPAGKIYQPEVAAEAIVWTAYHDRPEVQLGYPTVQAILGDKIAPRWLDHYVAHTVYDGHVTDIPDPPGRPDNLFDPVPGDFAAHGPYDAEATDHSAQWFLNKHRNALGLIGVGLLAAFGTAMLGRSRSNDRHRGWP